MEGVACASAWTWGVATCVLMESKRFIAWKGRDTTLSGWQGRAVADSLACVCLGQHCHLLVEPCSPSRDVPGMPGLAGPAESRRGQLSYTLKASYTPPGMGACSHLGRQIFFFS